jgi:hypothetical protein
LFVASNKLKYLSSGPLFRALIIPLKVRFATGSIPNVAEGSDKLRSSVWLEIYAQ